MNMNSLGGGVWDVSVENAVLLVVIGKGARHGSICYVLLVRKSRLSFGGDGCY